jgi:hypothetical protein
MCPQRVAYLFAEPMLKVDATEHLLGKRDKDDSDLLNLRKRFQAVVERKQKSSGVFADEKVLMLVGAGTRTICAS